VYPRDPSKAWLSKGLGFTGILDIVDVDLVHSLLNGVLVLKMWHTLAEPMDTLVPTVPTEAPGHGSGGE
jgi:hypothetical protein